MWKIYYDLNGQVTYFQDAQDVNKGIFYGTGDIPDYSISSNRPWNNDTTALGVAQVVFQEGITQIGSNTCANMPNLHSVIMYPGVMRIGRNVFAGCKNLKAIYYQGLETQWQKVADASAFVRSRDLPGITICFSFPADICTSAAIAVHAL